jgi:hypothetical protein
MMKKLNDAPWARVQPGKGQGGAEIKMMALVREVLCFHSELLAPKVPG